MQDHEHFYETARLDEGKLRELLKKENATATARFVLLYAGVLLSAAGLIYLIYAGADWYLWLPVLLLHSLLTGCGLFAAMHETVHQTAFRSRALNKWAARLASLWHVYAPSMFRELHYAHHRHTHVQGLDPEISLGRQPVRSVVYNRLTYIGWLTGLPLLLFKTGMVVMGALGLPESVREKIYPFARAEVRAEIAVESWAILLFNLGIGALGFWVDASFFALWLGTALGHSMLAFYVTGEHNGLPYEGDILARTRSMRTSAPVRWLMWNMPYHAEHHAYPAVPFHALPRLHEALKEDIQHRTGYGEFHWSVITAEIQKNEQK